MMFSKYNKLFMTSLFVLVLGACGGGEGGPSTGDTIVIENPVAPAPPAPPTVTGTFVDSPVSGLQYIGTPSGTSGLTGDTGVPGGFRVQVGDMVTFSISGLILGDSGTAVTQGRIITPADLAGDRTNAGSVKAIRIAQLLQSLDSDGNTSNGITISAATRSAMAAQSIAVRDGLQGRLTIGADFDTFLGNIIDDLTVGNSVPRAAGSIVSAAVASVELLEAVNQANAAQQPVQTSSVITAHPTGACPIGTLSNNKVTMYNQQFPVCVITAHILSNVTLTNNHVYVLQAGINIGNGDKLGGFDPLLNANVVVTVQAGTQVFGYNGLQTGLIVTRGSRLEAIGTPDLPIIFGAIEATGTGANVRITDDPTDLSKRGQWAGIVMAGYGFNNFCNQIGGVDEVLSEAVPTGSSRYFGCYNNADNSGTLKYVIIAESGLGFRPNQEVQGLTLESAGSGTVLDYIQVVGSDDDGIEWFGGAASASNIVINGAEDDQLDFDEGYQGTVQNALVIMGGNFGDKGIEADSAGPSANQEPVSRVNFVNMTMLGNRGTTNGTNALHFRLGFGGKLWRSAVVDHGNLAATGTGQFSTGCMLFNDQIDQFTAMHDVVFKCANGNQGTWGFGINTTSGTNFSQAFVTGGNDESASPIAATRRQFVTFTGTINPNTFAIDPSFTPSSSVTLPAGVNGHPIGNYIGAVDPNSGSPDGNPNNNGNGGGPFWDGWTYIDSRVDGKLPGANFHPLQINIIAGGQ